MQAEGGANVSDREVLVAAAISAGLDGEEAREVLTSGRYADEVRHAERLWQSRGISAVSAIVINEKWLISGGQPVEAFDTALQRIAGNSRRAPWMFRRKFADGKSRTCSLHIPRRNPDDLWADT